MAAVDSIEAKQAQKGVLKPRMCWGWWERRLRRRWWPAKYQRRRLYASSILLPWQLPHWQAAVALLSGNISYRRRRLLVGTQLSSTVILLVWGSWWEVQAPYPVSPQVSESEFASHKRLLVKLKRSTSTRYDVCEYHCRGCEVKRLCHGSGKRSGQGALVQWWKNSPVMLYSTPYRPT